MLFELTGFCFAFESEIEEGFQIKNLIKLAF